jgi:archaetidylinositol phosphate synthase
MGLYTWKFPFRKILAPLATHLKGVNPDLLSYLAVVVAFVTALCMYFAGSYPGLLFAVIILILARMTLNTLDGVIALAIGKSSVEGEIVNALPDRYSDIFLMLGIAFSSYCNVYLGIVAALSVLLVSYAGMLGKAVGLNWQHQGPLGKVERLILIMLACLAQYIMVRMGRDRLVVFSWRLSAIEICMGWFIIAAQISVYRRVLGAVREIKERKNVS